jgi:hypothetical protein
MTIKTTFEDFWNNEASSYSKIEGVIFCSNTNPQSLLPFALIRNLCEVEALAFCLQFWESCSRLAKEQNLTHISMRIADTEEISKHETDLTEHDWKTRICTLAGPVGKPPENGWFYSYKSDRKIDIIDGALQIASA